ncbi:MAG: NAD(P)-dependent alcohol dehydrogenase, partial [Polyangiaceae bacterium]
SLCRADKYVLQGRPFPLRFATGLVTPKKRGLGLDFAGDVVEVGREVDDVRVGDAVYGEAVLGATWAEYACVPARFVARKPRTLGYEEAAIVPDSALTALQGLVREGRLVAGRRVLVNGATGGVGSFAVQIAKARGAHVTAVCSRRHAESVRAWGADEVLAYETDDFTRGTERYDMVFDVAGNHPLSALARVIEPGGVIVAVGAPEGGVLGPGGRMIAIYLTSPFVAPRVAQFVESPDHDDLTTLAGLVDAGLVRPVLSRAFPLADTAEAFRFLADVRPAGKVGISVP